MHAHYFIEHFTNHPQFPLAGIITKDTNGQDCFVSKENKFSIDIEELSRLSNPAFIFFNSGRWIEEIKRIRKIFQNAYFLYRTGGNEILKASLAHEKISNHALRQAYWVKNLNDTINLLITNSAYTEMRLRDLGITCPFVRCVGGVNVSALKPQELIAKGPLKIFCAARFVPYKNHSLLLNVIHKLILRGHDIHLRLAGDGPLLTQAKEQVHRNGLTSVVEFLGVLDNGQACQEIANANIYMQFSIDKITEVPGGSYIHSEGMGRAILEALSAGTFVVVGRSGALSEIVTEDRGLLVKLSDEEQITNEIEHVFKSPLVRRPFLEHFSWANLFKRYEELLEGAH